MPVIKIQHICSASSENQSEPAENLLEGHKKWSCASAGEAKVIVVMQLEKSSLIHSVDIGNNGAAFVELLVGRSTAPDQYEPLVAMTSFMTPKESRQWGNINRVKIFDQQSFSKDAAVQKWDRVKLVCTQPYNKSEKYGLSFVKLQSPPDDSNNIATGTGPTPSSSKAPTKMGAFSLKDGPKDLPTGAMFLKKTEKVSAPAMSAAAEARKASADALAAVMADDTLPGRGGFPNEGSRKRKGSPGSSPASKKKKVEDASASRPFSKLLEGAVFALSGFKNPLRGELREKGVEMGALYQTDWDASCTHLICAFSNTPKYTQVKDKGGLIVGKEWILDCHSRKKRLPARKYRLASGGSSPDDGDRYDTREAAIFKQPDSSDTLGNKGQGSGEAPSSSKVTSGSPSSTTGVTGDEAKGGVANLDDLYGASTDEESESEGVKGVSNSEDGSWRPDSLETVDSDGDTEDEVERIRERERQKAGGSHDSNGKDRGGHTSLPSAPQRSLLDLPDFLSKLTVFLYGDFSPSDRRTLLRYVTAYGGKLVDYMDDTVTHVVTQQQWDDNFDQALTENSTLAFVHPRWIFTCHHKKQCVPHQPFVVAPS